MSGFPPQQPPFAQPPGMGGQFGPPTPGAPASAPPAPAGKKKTKEPKPANKRVVSVNRNAALGAAVLAGGMVVLMSMGSGPKQTWVARSAGPINALNQISEQSVKATQVTPDLLEEGAITGSTEKEALEKALSQIGDSPARFPIPAGSQLHLQQFGTETKLLKPLAPTERLISVQATVSNAVAGTLNAGDRVDIVGYDADSKATNLLLGDVEIVARQVSQDAYNSAAQQQTGEKGKSLKPEDLIPQDPIPGLYVVRVPADQVIRLLAVGNNGTLHLVLRGEGAQPLPDNLMTSGTAIRPQSQLLR